MGGKDKGAKFVQATLSAECGHKLSYQWCFDQVRRHIDTAKALAEEKKISIPQALVEVIRPINKKGDRP